MRFDLHLHTTASDGRLSAEELVEAALAKGLSAIAITDHDSVDSVRMAQAAAAESGEMQVLPGVELSSLHEGRDVHILGYFVDPQDPQFLDELTALRDARLQRAREMVEVLAQAGYDISMDEVLEMSSGGAVGRSHVARALVSNGHTSSVAEAFERFIGRGRPFYVAKPARSPGDVVAVIRRAGGLAVLAHPGVTKVDGLIGGLVQAGLAGLEAFHGEHTHEDRERYRALAATYDLLVTGGSDFHGHRAVGAELGGVEMPDSVLTDLLAARDELGRTNR